MRLEPKRSNRATDNRERTTENGSFRLIHDVLATHEVERVRACTFDLLLKE